MNIGKWVIDKELGSGSMGTVYLAHDARVASQIRALKVVHPDLAKDEQFRKRFFTEFEVLESLRHPHIMLVYDYLEEPESLVLVNEFLDGRTLKEELGARGGGLPWESVAQWMRQALAALSFAHAKKVVHRDIKPSNLFLCKDGTVKVIDFGLAKKLGDSGASLTLAGQIVGTPAYMAPELAERPPHPGSDIYALGATMHHLLTGKLPFDTSMSKGDPILAMLKAHWTQKPPDLRVSAPGIPDSLVAVVERAMAKDPVERFASAAEMAEALEKAASRPIDPTETFLHLSRLGEEPPQREPIPDRKTEPEPAGVAGPTDSFLNLPGLGAEKAEAERVPKKTQPPTPPVHKRRRVLWLAAAAALACIATATAVGLRPSPKKTADGVADLPAPRQAAAEKLSATATASPTIGCKFVAIPSGSFRMGSPSDEPGRYVDETQHEVTISHAFLLGTTDVTQGQWQKVMGSNPSFFKACGDDCAVDSVSWNDAVGFCNRLSDTEGLSRCYSGSGNSVAWNRSCTGYRLPSEAEWEYAARSGGTTALYTGALTIRGEYHGPELDGIAWYGGNSGVSYSPGVDCSGWNDKQYSSSTCGTHPVAHKQANDWGLYDMLGNVWQWVWDWKADYPSGSVADPTGPSRSSNRVHRGGSWHGAARVCRSANRSASDPVFSYDNVGFRLARSLP